jgi:succinate dehydrogenase/fumarate reductase flavoprotein subunit
MGANRLSGNAVTECVVFGALAGVNAAKFAKNTSSPVINMDQVELYQEQVYAPLNRKDGFDIFELRGKLQELAFKYMGPVREETGLATCLKEIDKLKREALPNLAAKAKGQIYNREWIAALENQAMLQVLEIVIRSSLLRKESRGAMYRLDYTDTDNKNWLKNIIVKVDDGEVSLNSKPVVTEKITLPAREKIPYMIPQWKFEKKA